MVPLELLQTLDILEGTPPAEIEHLLMCVTDVRSKPGEYVVREGDAPSLVIPLQGTFDVIRRLGPFERAIGTRAPGDFYGELPLMLGSPSFAGLRSVGDARALKIGSVAFHAVLRASPALQERIRRRLHDRVDGLFELAAVAPPAAVSMAGVRYDRATLAICDFLTRHQIAFEFIDIADPALPDLMPEAIGQLEHCPLLQVSGGVMLAAPTFRTIARHLRLQTEPRFHEYDLVIVGGGPAALAAALHAASEGLRTLAIERATSDCELSTERYDDNLASPSLQQAIQAGAEILVTRDVIAIDPGDRAHEIRLDDGEIVTAHSILLATGVSWRMLQAPGVARLTGAGIFLGTEARTEAMNVRGKAVYIAGSGESAERTALFMAEHAYMVTLLAAGGEVGIGLGNRFASDVQGKHNVRIERSSEIVGVHGNGRLQAVDVADRETGVRTRRPADAIFVFAGGDAQTDWLPREIARDDRGYVITGVHALLTAPELWPLSREPYLLETSVPGIFATGDVRAGSVKRLAAEIGESSMAVASIHEYLAGMKTSAPTAAAS